MGEFSAIIGMIKRTQRLLGRVYTVSGVCSCFRRLAIHEVGYWSSDTVTEDVDISWKLQLAYWGILYEPRAVCWILVPESLRGLWRQRLRWARGGMEAAICATGSILHWTKRRMWPVLRRADGQHRLVLRGLPRPGRLDPHPVGAGVDTARLQVATLLPGWSGSLLAVVCLLQFLTGLTLDRRYEGRRLLRQTLLGHLVPGALLGHHRGYVGGGAAPRAATSTGGPAMPPGKAPIAESSTLDALLARQWSRRRPLPTGLLALLTVLFWGVWLYLVLPLVSLLLWAFGVRFLVGRSARAATRGCAPPLIAYWRGPARPRRPARLLDRLERGALWRQTATGAPSSGRRCPTRRSAKAFRIDDSLLSVLRGERLVRVDFEGDGVVVIADAPASRGDPGDPGDGSGLRTPAPGPQRARDSTRSG